MNRIAHCLLSLLIIFAGQVVAAEVDFNRDVRPILSDKCYACHGPDQEQRQSELRFDTEAGAFQDLGGYFAIVPGKPSDSQLVSRIASSDPDEQMPPPEHPKQLTDLEKETLIDWIRQGAEWKVHWSYLSPKRFKPRGSVPANNEWTRNFIDSFIGARLAESGLLPSPEADLRTQMRRLSFDLNGLPPSPAEVDEFLADSSEQAYESVVDRLLRSPHFGERLAMYWLDLVRYADTVGYHGDQDVSVSPYRDYVINALNSNMPFDQFTREQLAGDLLSAPSQQQLVASGYNKLGMMSAEGGVQPEEYLAKYAADRVRTASTVWMGSTLGCAECHDHKFDPFTSRDFYRFASFFADVKERGLYSGANTDGNWGPFVNVEDVGLAGLLEPVDASIAELDGKLHAVTSELSAAQAEWEEQQIEQLLKWSTLRPDSAESLQGTKLTLAEDGSLLASGPNPDQNTYNLMVSIPSNDVSAIRLEVLPDSSLPKQGPGRARNGNFVVSEIRLFKLEDTGESQISFRNASASIEQQADEQNPYGRWSAKSAIDDDVHGSSWGWAVSPEVGKPHALVIELSESLLAGKYKVVIEQNHTNPKHTLGKFRLSTTEAITPVTAEQLVDFGKDVRTALLVEKNKRSKDQTQTIFRQFRQVTPKMEIVREELKKVRQQREELVAKNTRSSLVTEVVEPREMRVLNRGNWMDKSGEVVMPGVPHFLRQVEGQGRATRLDLANWLVSSDNPLTARVFVNRLWKLYFGTGLAKNLDDVGSQGESPSHPELLDTLAVEFIESGWDIKHIIKLMVMSSTYRQSSLMRKELESVDPYNRLLARQSRYRLEAELVRDNALAISDLLVRKIGGRSVKPYQPAGLYRHLNFPTRTYKQDSDSGQYRRGLYTHWQRQFLHPAMQAFDAPAREECTAERPRSNTPLAALVLLNDPSYVEAARRFAENVIRFGGQRTEWRLKWMMRTALSRLPSKAESDVFMQLLNQETVNFSEQPKKARQLISIGLSEPNEELDPVELAAWTSVTRAVLNMHEIVTRN